MKNSRNKIITHSLWLLGLGLLSLIAYVGSFNAAFQLDDYSSILGNGDVNKGGRFLTDFWLKINERPLSLFTLSMNYRLVEMEPFYYHVTNFVIHLLNTLLVFRLSCLVFDRLKIGANTFWYALVTAALFALHPLQTAAVTYIVQRMTELSALFYLLSCVQYIRMRTLQTTGKSKALIRWLWIVLFFFLGLLSKQNVVSLPLTFIIFEVFLFTSNQQTKKLRQLTVGTLLMLFLGALIILSDRLPVDADYTPLEYGLTQTKVVWEYFRLMVFPSNQVAFSSYPLSTALGAIEAIALLGHLMLIGAALYFRNRFSLIALGILWMYSTLSVESSLLPIVDLYFEHRNYLAIIGFSWVLIGIAHGFVPLKKVSLGIFTAIIVVFAFLTHQRNKVWETPYTFWTDIIEKEPHNARAHVGLAAYYERKNNDRKNYELLLKSFELKPNYEAAYNLGSYFLKRNQLQKAQEWFDQAIALNPSYAPAWNNLGTIATKRNQQEKALELYQKAVQLNAEYLEAKFNSGLTAMRLNQLELAEAMFYNYLDLQPNYVPALFNSARVSIMLNKYDQAQLQLNKLFKVDPNNRAGMELQRYLNENRPGN